MSLSHFDQASGIVTCDTPWGRWWQTLHEVFIEIDVPPGTRGKDCLIEIQPKRIRCVVHNKEMFKERKKIVILLGKAEGNFKNAKAWESLLVDRYAPNPLIMQEMMKKIDLEQFQIENPGFDFSNATLSKTYDKIPCSSKNL